MTYNLMEEVRKKLGYEEIQKVDPNTQEVESNTIEPNSKKFAQAALPAVLTALLKFSQTDEGANALIGGNISTDWMDLLYGDKAPLAIERVADYSMHSDEIARKKMNEIASTALSMVNDQFTTGEKTQHIKNFMAKQSTNILPYLPAALRMGELLNDSTLDDRTHKMEGPISSFMHSIETKMSTADNRNTERE